MKVFFLALCPCSSGKSFMILAPLNTVCLCCISLSMPQDGSRLSSIMIPDSHADIYEAILISELLTLIFLHCLSHHKVNFVLF